MQTTEHVTTDGGLLALHYVWIIIVFININA
jgi:hypothetical protein